MQIETALSVDRLEQVVIVESNEPLVEIVETEKLRLVENHPFLVPRLRRSACERLVNAATSLPDGHRLLVITAFRPLEMQRKLWRRRLWRMAKQYPFKMIFRHREWMGLAGRYTAPPGGSSHQCGGAVDVTVIGGQGSLDMGTRWSDDGERVHTWTTHVTEAQKHNRMMLYDVMTGAGFVNYPNEWWHYSYGDRMWAAYSRERSCFYGPV